MHDKAVVAAAAGWCCSLGSIVWSSSASDIVLEHVALVPLATGLPLIAFQCCC